MVARQIFLLALIAAVDCGCVKDPVIPSESAGSLAGDGILVFNEGLFGRDNASVTYYDRATGETRQNFYEAVNPGLRLGDTANSLFVRDGLGYVVMSGSNAIEIIDMATAASRGRILLPGNASPRHAVVLNDTVGFVTALFADAVFRFNPQTQAITGSIAVGPAPEGIVLAAGRVFVVNSGLGDIRAQEDGAGTVSVIDPASQTELARLPVLYNCVNLTAGPDGLVYAGGTGSFFTEVVAGIAVIDPVALTVIDTIAISHHPADFVLDASGLGYVITDSAVVKFSWRTREVIDERFIARERLSREAWLFTLAVEATHQELCVSNARNFSTNGEAVCFDMGGREKFRFATRINPGTIVFRE